jgi:hypothetical protein
MKEAKVMPNRNATAAVIGVGDYIEPLSRRNLRAAARCMEFRA